MENAEGAEPPRVGPDRGEGEQLLLPGLPAWPSAVKSLRADIHLHVLNNSDGRVRL